jgi:predicted MPP superfamily phosphohydrolase
MAVRLLLFVLVTALLLGACGRYVHRRAAALAGLGPRGRRGLAAVIAGGVILMVGSRVFYAWLPAAVLRPADMAGSAVGVALFLTTCLLLPIDLAVWALAVPRRIARRIRREPPPAPTPASPPPEAAPTEVSRRGFITQALTGSAILVGSGSAVYGTFFGRHDYQIEDLVVRIPGLSPRLDGFTLVQLSDVHLGLFSGEPEARAAEDLVRKARPDLIVLTGDLIDHDPSYAPALGRLARRLSALSRGGIVAVPGNHDYYAGIDQVLGALEEAGAVVLRNQGRLIGDAGARFALLGVDDRSGRGPVGPGPDLDAALASLPAAADLPRVLLCHNPAYFTEAAGRVALQLSGHTHGGQIRLGVSPASVVLGHRYIAGRYEQAGSSIYVNRGFGTAGPPTRVGAPPEVTRIVLTG